MANYPSYTISIDSVPVKENDAEDDFAQSGQQHSRIFHDRQYYRFPITHPSLTASEYAALEALYEAGPRDSHTLTYYNTSPVTTYTVKFMQPPDITENHGNSRFRVEVLLRGYKN